MAELSRSAGHGRAAAPVRAVHLGVGNFFRAHQAAYTDRAPDAADWGIAAYGGRSGGTAEVLAAQDGLYSLVARSADGDRIDVVSSIARAHGAAEHDRWLRDLATPEVAVVTITVTEAGYLLDANGSLDLAHQDLRDDIRVLHDDPTARVRSAPGRLVAGLAARRRADAGPLAVVPCDNLSENGPVVDRVLREMAQAVDPALADWIGESVSVVSTVVDRITPRPGDDLQEVVRAATGLQDRSPVVTEPFTEWLLAGTFPAGRPEWEGAGAGFVDDVTPFEHRKLWLLNGAHSLLAYAAPARGHRTVAEATQDQTCVEWVQEWWDEAVAHLDLPGDELDDYRDALTERFANHRIEHELAQISADGSLKLPVRILPVLRAERAEGQMPTGATRALAGWVAHLRADGSEVQDPRAGDLADAAAGELSEAVPRILASLDPELADDPDLLEAVADQARELAR